MMHAQVVWALWWGDATNHAANDMPANTAEQAGARECATSSSAERDVSSDLLLDDDDSDDDSDDAHDECVTVSSTLARPLARALTASRTGPACGRSFDRDQTLERPPRA